MNQKESYPSPYEVNAFTKAAVKACDKLDSIEDGIISLPKACNVTAYDFVGQEYSRNGTLCTLTASAAEVIDAAWSGSGPDGYFGLNKDANLTSYLVLTECSTNGTCSSSESPLANSWISYLVAKDPNFNMNNMTGKDFFNILRDSKSEYQSMIATNSPDLSAFKTAGGKMITWHGLADEVIPPNGTISYYEEVLVGNEDVPGFYRFFEAPGVGHCFDGSGPVPKFAFSQLVDWVEGGTAPDTLHAVKNSNISRILCPYPLRQKFIGEVPGMCHLLFALACEIHWSFMMLKYPNSCPRRTV